MSGYRSFIFGSVFSALSIITPSAGLQAVPLAAPAVETTAANPLQTIDYRGWNGTGYRPYRPYEYRPYRPYRPYAAPYAYRPYYRPYYRPGVEVYVTPRPAYRDAANLHVEWCLARYRSYNPQTNRFLTYGGIYKYCHSPYR
ncbi:hypothetical protein QO002_000656 [Pararhizobium capsulatum DSM 1112]|uniref:Lectin-like protein BA14k n=1 Tax=Pararhizobium capsulatum DSM 1112 TaxID=1121113 RepID=A0ABU0BKT8_9HYPH|nr:BA14K family protein [Pararhizobium capsulatum]MDQ0318518.1 hypothetical protein [Pararhizobium capsulatum DSM 1112]